MESSTEDKTTSDIREELQKFKEENGMLNRRLLGVNELARLLQEKSELCEELKEKNKRLEIAVVRLENRCSNLEKKMKASQFSSLPSNTGSGNSKGMPNSPFIPGPSRQILESLMKENHELKKTINNLTKGGPVGYREAVKMSHLEEVIDQKNEKIELLQKQIETLTAPHSEEGPSVAVDPGLLKRQVLKMEQAMKVKDRFCSLLSDRVTQLQSELNASKDTVDGNGETPLKSKGESDSSQMERNSRKVIDELQSQVEKERNEKKEMIKKAEESTRKVTALESEIASLSRQLESLGSYNDTLVREKMDLSGDVMRLNDKLQQMQLKGILNQGFSGESDKAKKAEEEIHILEEKIKDLEEEKITLNNQVFEMNVKLSELKNQGTKSRMNPIFSLNTGRMTTGGASSIVDNLSTKEVTVDSAKMRASPEPQHCGTNIVGYYHRQEIPLFSRSVGTDGSSETTIPVTPTTSTNSQSPAKPKSLEIISPQMRLIQNPTTPQSSQIVPWYQHGGQPQHPEISSYQTHARSAQIVTMPNIPQTGSTMMGRSQYHGTGSVAHLPSGPGMYGGNYPTGGSVFGNTSGVNQPSHYGVPVSTQFQQYPLNQQQPGSSYMTHSSNGGTNAGATNEHSRFYNPNAQTPQRRQSPPGQHQSHYHTGPQ